MFWQQFTTLTCEKPLLTKTSLHLYLVATSPVLTGDRRDDAHVEQMAFSPPARDTVEEVAWLLVLCRCRCTTKEEGENQS